MTRRQALVAAVVLPPAARAMLGTTTARAAGSSLPAAPSLWVAGPAGSPVDRWGELIAGPLGAGLVGQSDAVLMRENFGGLDGVTGANQFQARTALDGATALLLPGAALMAWLVGDTRVQFDVGVWAPLWGITTDAIVATRAPLVAGRPLRVAVPAIGGPGLDALLALELMGIEPIPVTGTGRDEVDAVYLRGGTAHETLAGSGFHAAFAIGGPRPHEQVGHNLPLATDLFLPSQAADPEAIAMFQAVSTAASLEAALVMPAVTAATVLAWWRHGCAQMDDAAAVRAATVAVAVRQDDAGQIAAQLSHVALDMPAMLSLRTHLAERYHWRPS